MHTIRKRKNHQWIAISIIAILTVATISAEYYEFSLNGRKKKEVQRYEDFHFGAEPFLNPDNDTVNGGGWDGYLYPAGMCEATNCPKYKHPSINETIFSIGHSKKFFGGRHTVLLNGSVNGFNVPVYIYSMNGSIVKSMDHGVLRPLNNGTVIQLGTKELHTIENAALVYIDGNKNGKIDLYDEIIIFRDWNSDGTLETGPNNSELDIEIKGLDIAYGGLGWYYNVTYSAIRNGFFVFKTNSFENRSHLDNRTSGGWYSVLVWLNHSVDNNLTFGQMIDLTPPLSLVEPILSGISYNGYQHLFFGPITLAKVTCDRAPFNLYAFAYPALGGMKFDDNGSVRTLTNATACGLDRNELVTVTGAAFIFLDNDRDGTFSVNDAFYAYRPIDNNGRESIDLYAATLAEPEISISLTR